MDTSRLNLVKHRRRQPRPGKLTMTIGKRGNVTTPAAVFEAMGSPKAIEVLYDKDQRVIAVRATDPSDPDSYPVRKVSGNGRTRAFSLSALVAHYGIDVSQSRRYEVEMDGSTALVDLTRPPIAVFDKDEENTDEASDAQPRLAV